MANPAYKWSLCGPPQISTSGPSHGRFSATPTASSPTCEVSWSRSTYRFVRWRVVRSLGWRRMTQGPRHRTAWIRETSFATSVLPPKIKDLFTTGPSIAFLQLSARRRAKWEKWDEDHVQCLETYQRNHRTMMKFLPSWFFKGKEHRRYSATFGQKILRVWSITSSRSLSLRFQILKVMLNHAVSIFWGNYNIISIFAHFSKSCNAFQYHIVCFYHIIHFKMSVTKSLATFVQYYNIIHVVCTSALYHAFDNFCSCHLCLPQHFSYSVLYIEHEVPHCHVLFHHHYCFAVVDPALC